MRTPTYASLVLLVFIRNIDIRQVDSIRGLISVTDKLAVKLGITVDISYMTKFNIG